MKRAKCCEDCFYLYRNMCRRADYRPVHNFEPCRFNCPLNYIKFYKPKTRRRGRQKRHLPQIGVMSPTE
jgi:hypothetical protein